jgi:hypothetical protein
MPKVGEAGWASLQRRALFNQGRSATPFETCRLFAARFAVCAVAFHPSSKVPQGRGTKHDRRIEHSLMPPRTGILSCSLPAVLKNADTDVVQCLPGTDVVTGRTRRNAERAGKSKPGTGPGCTIGKGAMRVEFVRLIRTEDVIVDARQRSTAVALCCGGQGSGRLPDQHPPGFAGFPLPARNAACPLTISGASQTEDKAGQRFFPNRSDDRAAGPRPERCAGRRPCRWQTLPALLVPNTRRGTRPQNRRSRSRRRSAR